LIFFFSIGNAQISTGQESIPGSIIQDRFLTEKTVVSGIYYSGNNKTKPHIIAREIGWKVGDTLLVSKITGSLDWIKNRIFNTGLFLSVSLHLKKVDSINCVLLVDLKERFYTYPIPTLDLADRNFNEWWVQRNRDLNRLDVGMYLKQKNLRGRNETFKLKFTLGFNKKVEVQYQFPYINKGLKTGLTIFSGIIWNRQVAFQTRANTLDYMETPSILRTRITGGFYFTRRNNFYSTHQAGVNYLYTDVGDSVVSVNSDYLLDSASRQHSLSLKYSFLTDHRDFAKYALKGYYLLAEAEQFVFYTNRGTHYSGQVRVESAAYLPLGKRWNWANAVRMKFSGPSRIGYFNQRAFGYKEDYVTGYQLYVIDGTQFYLLKSHLRWRLLSWNWRNPLMPLTKFKRTPLTVYLKMIGESGYVVQPMTYGPGNTLGNQLLYGYGLGLDMSTYYDVVARIDFAFNRLNQFGIYLHLKAAF
jgi:outer membrane protein assembly factor BamA